MLIACHSSQTPADREAIQTPIGTVYDSAEIRRSGDELLNAQLDGDRKRREAYAKENAPYRLQYPTLPATKSVKLPLTDNYCIDASKLLPVALEKGVCLQMKLGRRIPLEVNDHTFRTATRYVLTIAGREVGSAEGLIAKVDDGNGGGEARFVYNETTREILIEEEIGGAGAQQRHIAYLPVGSDAKNRDQLPRKWRQVYVRLPGYWVVGSEGEINGAVHGIQEGKIIVEMDGAFYAYPVDDFVLESLEFTVG